MSARTRIFDREVYWAKSKDLELLVSGIAKSKHKSVLFCNVHMLMLSQHDDSLAKAMDDSAWVFADGVPVAWLQQKIEMQPANVIRGYEIMLAICKRAALNGEKVGFIGSTANVMEKLTSKLGQQFKGLNVAYKFSPPFMKNELLTSESELMRINESGIKWLFVGLGCPKQEKWISKYHVQLNCHSLGVGAAFDWISGVTKKPPNWMEKFALAWLFRLLTQPVKTGHRYFKYNTEFIVKVIPLLLKRK